MANDSEYSKLTWEDEFEIRLLSDKLFHGADRHEDLTDEIWAKDCTFELNMREPTEIFRGRDAIREAGERITRYTQLQRFSCHMMSHVYLRPAGDRVLGQGVGIMTLVYDPVKEGGKVLVRGIHYDDEYIREDGSWRILKRVHQPVWQYEATTVPHGVPIAPGS